jgi:hypothetical protein
VIRMLAAIFACIVGLSGTVFAAQSNFSSGNMSGDTPYVGEQKDRQSVKDSAKARTEKKPGFWGKELERSGLAKVGENTKKGLKKMTSFHINIPNFFTNQEEKYIARKASRS